MTTADSDASRGGYLPATPASTAPIDEAVLAEMRRHSDLNRAVADSGVRPLAPDCMTLVLRPVIRDEAVAFIRQHHRHAKRSLPGWKFGVGLWATGLTAGLQAVGIAGRCSSRVWDKLGGGEWIEVTRVCTLGTPNACSQLYGALTRASKALGYCTAWTYTLDRESGASLRASGWIIDAELPARSGWDCASRPRDEADWPAEAKVRWKRVLHACARHRRYQELTEVERQEAA